MKQRYLSVVLAFLLLSAMGSLALPSTMAARAQEGELPTPREETLYWRTHGSGYFLYYDKWNPFVAGAWQRGNGVHMVCVEWLFYLVKTTGEFINWLGTGYEYNEDYTELTFFIREGVKWSDGVNFTAADVVFTINMLIDGAPDLLYSINVEEFVDTVEMLDDYTVFMKLKKPNPRFHLAFTEKKADAVPIVPKHIWEGEDPFTFANNPPVFTGPYRFVEAKPDIYMVIWERRDDYWGKALGYFPEPKYMVMQIGTPVDVSYSNLRDNIVDVSRLSGATQMQLIEAIKRENPDIVLMGGPRDGSSSVAFNCAIYPLNYSEFRWAVSYCVNYEKLAKLNPWVDPGDCIPPRTVFTENWAEVEAGIFEDVIAKYTLEYDLDKANALLDGLGFTDRTADGIRVTPNGTVLSFELICRYAAGHYYYECMVDTAKEAKKVGIEIIVKHLPSAQVQELLRWGDYEMAQWYSGGIGGEPIETYTTYHSRHVKPPGEEMISGQPYRWVNTEFDALVEQAEALPKGDPGLEPIYKELLEIWMRELPTVPCYQTMFEHSRQATEAYWKGWPTKGNLYASHLSYLGTCLFVVFRLTKGEVGLEAGFLKQLEATNAEIAALTATIEDLEESIAGMADVRTYGTAGIALSVVAIAVAVIAVVRKPKVT